MVAASAFGNTARHAGKLPAERNQSEEINAMKISALLFGLMTMVSASVSERFIGGLLCCCVRAGGSGAAMGGGWEWSARTGNNAGMLWDSRPHKPGAGGIVIA